MKAANEQDDPGPRFAALEQKLLQQEARLDQQAGDLARLNLWQQGRQLAYVARLYPKTRSVIFLHPDFFADNVKYAFLDFLPVAAKQGIDCHFLINNDRQRETLVQNGLPVLPPLNQWTIEHMRLVLGARVAVISDDFTPRSWSPPLPYFLLQGTRLVQLWHGIPFKEIGLLYSDTQKDPLSSLRLASTGPADLFVAPGDAMRSQWRQWFAFREFAPAGYPRTDALLRPATKQDLINVDTDTLKDAELDHNSGRKVIFYAPTFRDHIGAGWLQKTDFAAFAKWCREKNHFLVVKLHPVEAAGVEDMRRAMPDIRFVRPDSDIYPLLRLADVMITDYSSLAFDFMLLDRPIVFYWPDHKDYLAQCRQLLPGSENYLAGEQVTDASGLCRAVESMLFGGDTWSGKRQAIRDALFDHKDGHAGGRVARLILEMLDKPDELPAQWGL